MSAIALRVSPTHAHGSFVGSSGRKVGRAVPALDPRRHWPDSPPSGRILAAGRAQNPGTSPGARRGLWWTGTTSPEGSCETRLARCESGDLGLTAKMLWSLNAWALRSLPRNLLGLLGLLLRISAALPDQVCTLQMTLRDFRPILSWEYLNPEFEPTHYTLSYTIMSKIKSMKMVENCIHITKPFCDLTDEWQDLGETYIPKVVGSQGNRTLRDCMGDIMLITNMSLEPPKFEIHDFLDHIKVIIHFPLHVPSIIKELLTNYHPLVIEEQLGVMVKKHNPKIYENKVGNFSYVIDKLIPNMNYCISVYFEHSKSSLPPTIQCSLLHEPDSSDSGMLGGIIFLSLMVAVITSLLLIMKRTGYICLRKDFPKVLLRGSNPGPHMYKNLCNTSAYEFLDMPRPEKTDLVEEVILVKKKKKVCNHDDYNDDDDDESDSEDEEASEASPGGYTMHGLVGRLLSTSSSITLDDSQHSTSDDAAPAEPEAGTELPAVPRSDSLQWECTMGACEGTGDQPKDPFAEEEATSTEGSGDSRIFNVDLKSVCVRSLEDELSRDSLMPTSLLEDSMDLQDPDDTDSGQMENSAAGTWLTLAERLWSEDGDPSEESDTQSESDFCFGDGYIIR